MTQNVHVKAHWDRVEAAMDQARKRFDAVARPSPGGIRPDEEQWRLVEAAQRQAQLELLLGLSHDLEAIAAAISETR